MLLRAYAKVNLTLEVMGRRDDGYHEIVTILQNVDLYDTLRLEPASRIEFTCSEAGLAGEDNLVWQAARALQQVAGSGCGARIHLEKGIPEAMGLGGGSSDAAAALAGLSRLWGLRLSASQLSRMAADLGSDAPFFLEGGTAMAEGRGERVTVLPALPRRWLLLLCPDIHLRGKTGHLYRSLSAEDYSDGATHRAAVEAIKGGQFPTGFLCNAFEQVARRTYGGLDGAIEAMLRAGASQARLCGSGPGLYTIIESHTQGQMSRKLLQDEGYRAYLVSTTQKGWESICQG